jgi:hypothetical protein
VEAGRIIRVCEEVQGGGGSDNSCVRGGTRWRRVGFKDTVTNDPKQ